MKGISTRERNYMALYWSKRAESVSTVVARVSRFFVGMRELSRLFEHWYVQADSKAQALARPIHLDDQMAIESLILDDLKNNEGRGDASLGLGIWNGKDGLEGAAVTIFADIGDTESPFPNSVVVDLPLTDAFVDALAEGLAARLLRSTVIAWEPIAGVVTSNELRRAIYGRSAPIPQVGWVTYLSAQAQRIPIAEEFDMTRVDGFGTIVTLKGRQIRAVADERSVLALQQLSHLLGMNPTHRG